MRSTNWTSKSPAEHLNFAVIVPMLCMGMQPVTLRVTERGASLEAFPRRAWERSTSENQ